MKEAQRMGFLGNYAFLEPDCHSDADGGRQSKGAPVLGVYEHVGKCRQEEIEAVQDAEDRGNRDQDLTGLVQLPVDPCIELSKEHDRPAREAQLDELIGVHRVEAGSGRHQARGDIGGDAEESVAEEPA